MATYQDPLLQPNANATNPTAVNAGNPQFGESSQFNIAPFMQPFPFEQQAGQNQAFNQQFTGFLEGLETPEATRERFENRYGYQPLAEEYFRSSEALSDVGSAIRATPDNVQQRVNRSGTIVNQGQLANIQNKEVADLMETYTQLGQINEQQGQRLAFIEQNMNEAAKLEMAQQSKLIQPWLMAYDDKNIMQAREFTGYTFANQMELDRLLANQQAGLQWTDAEKNRAHQLSMQESLFSHQINMLEKQNEYALDLWGNF